ncbi:hypothetical protein ACU4GH_04105 [Bradyrhizobium betae]
MTNAGGEHEDAAPRVDADELKAGAMPAGFVDGSAVSKEDRTAAVAHIQSPVYMFGPVTVFGSGSLFGAL